MANSQNANAGCFSNILRRLLCKGSAPTHPSEHIAEAESNTKNFDRKQREEEALPEFSVQVDRVPANPGVVARLMGLDSLPNTIWIPQPKTPDSVRRSRSVNFMDYLLEFDLVQPQHRRVRTSLSFREVPPPPPTCLNQQNHGILVLQLDSLDERKTMRSRQRKSEMGSEEKQKKKEDISKKKENRRERVPVKTEINPRNNKKNEARRVCNGAKVSGRKGTCGLVSKEKSPLKPKYQREVSVELKFTKKKKKEEQRLQAVKKTKPAECNTENASPGSILDEIHLSEDAGPIQLSSHLACISLKRIKKKDCEDNREANCYIELVGKVIEEDIKKANLMVKSVFELEDFKDICMEFERRILDLLLHEVVDEVVRFQMEIFSLACNA